MFIEIEVKPSIIMHGFDHENKEIEEYNRQVEEYNKEIDEENP